MDKSVRDYLYQHEAQNGLLLGLWGSFNKSNSLIVLRDSNQQITLVAAYIDQPYRNLVLSHTSVTDPSELIKKCEELKLDLGGIVGTQELVKPFVQIWVKKVQTSAKIVMEQMLYEMKTLKPHQKVQGADRIAQKKDFDILTEWNIAFRNESMPDEPIRRMDAEKAAQMAIVNQDTFIWDVNGVDVSSAQIARPTENSMSVRYVYTPPEHRKRGYASAVTAAASEAIFAKGKKSCVLYTDAMNPTSNKIYQNLGYEWVCNSIYYRFLKA